MADTAITHRRVLTIAIPIVLSNVTVPLLGIVDTGVVGQLGAAAPIGAVGIGAIILTAFYWVFSFLRMGTTGMTAQALGEGNTTEVAALLARALLVGLLAGLVMIALQWPIMALGFWASPASAEVEDLARSYMGIRIWSAPAAIALYGITGWLIAQERGRAVLLLQLWMNGLNIILDLWFVLGLDWGVEGVAQATLWAEWSGLLLGLWMCRSAFASQGWFARKVLFAPEPLRRMIAVNRDIMIRSLLLQAIMVSFLFWSGGLGDVALAANQVLLQFLQFTAYALDGFAFAVEALVGRAIGAGSLGSFHRSIRLASFWAGLISLILALAFWIFGEAIIAAMTTSVEVRSTAGSYLWWLVLAPVVGCAAWMLDGIFIGATRAKDMRDMMVISAAVYFLAAPILLSTFGNHGLWLAMHISFVIRGLSLWARFGRLELAISSR